MTAEELLKSEKLNNLCKSLSDDWQLLRDEAITNYMNLRPEQKEKIINVENYVAKIIFSIFNTQKKNKREKLELLSALSIIGYMKELKRKLKVTYRVKKECITLWYLRGLLRLVQLQTTPIAVKSHLPKCERYIMNIGFILNII